jgi:hypothetical protein
MEVSRLLRLEEGYYQLTQGFAEVTVHNYTIARGYLTNHRRCAELGLLAVVS